MSLRKLAQLIPAEYRKEILDLNMIDTAIPNNTDTSMHYLGVIWKEYIEPDFTPDCNLCYSRVLDNMKKLKPILVELEQQHRLLNQVKE